MLDKFYWPLLGPYSFGEGPKGPHRAPKGSKGFYSAAEGQALSKNHYEVAKTFVNLANAHGALGDPTTKQKMLERAFRVIEKHHGEDHYEVAITLFNLAMAHEALGDIYQAKNGSKNLKYQQKLINQRS